MSEVMLIQSNVRMDRAVARRAIAEAKSRNEGLLVVAVLDATLAEKVAEQFTEAGHIGARPSEGFLNSMHEHHEQLALQQVDETVRDGRAEGLEVRAVVRRGDYATEAAQVVREEKPSTVVIEKRRRSLLQFAASRTFIDALQKQEGFRLIEA